MNANKLTNLYDRLAPRERWPLIVAAQLRGDELERERLIDSAPMYTYRLSNHFGLSQGLQLLGLTQVIRLLDLAVRFRHASGLLECIWRVHPNAKERHDPLWEAIQMSAYFLVAQYEGWKQFCAELNIDGEQFLRTLTNPDTVENTVSAARPLVPAPKAMLAILRRDKPEAELATPARIAESLHQDLEQYAARWA
jgi:hypothetical protein